MNKTTKKRVGRRSAKVRTVQPTQTISFMSLKERDEAIRDGQRIYGKRGISQFVRWLIQDYRHNSNRAPQVTP